VYLGPGADVPLNLVDLHVLVIPETNQMGRASRTHQTSMGLQIEIECVGMGDNRVNDRASRLDRRSAGQTLKFHLQMIEQLTKFPDLSFSCGFLAKKRIECLLAQMMTGSSISVSAFPVTIIIVALDLQHSFGL
jgi:hypothetical protein